MSKKLSPLYKIQWTDAKGKTVQSVVSFNGKSAEEYKPRYLSDGRKNVEIVEVKPGV